MSTYNRVLSRFEKAKSLKNIITWKEDEKLKNPNDIVDSKGSPESNAVPVTSNRQEINLTGLEVSDLAELLQKECDTRLQLTDELVTLRSKLNEKNLVVKDLEVDQASLTVIKDQFASELEKTKRELSSLQGQFAQSQNEITEAEQSSFAAKNEIERLCSEVGSLEQQKLKLESEMEQQKLKSATEIEQLTVEIGIMKGNYHKLEVMFSDTSRHEKIQYENTAKTRDELEKVTGELAAMVKENSISKAVKLELEEQVSQLEDRLDEARVKFEEMALSAQDEIAKANKKIEELEESKKEESSKLERKSVEVDSLLKDTDALKNTFEAKKKALELEHNSNVKRLEEGFLATLQARDEELEKYKIVSNKYKKKNESLSKDIRNLLGKLENQQNANPAPINPTVVQASSVDSGTPPILHDNDSSFVQSSFLQGRSSISSVKLKDKLERANSWVKQIKIRRKIPRRKSVPSRPEQLKQRRCADIGKLSKSQLVAKCLALQLENGDRNLQVQSFNEQVRNLKFANMYLAHRLSSIEQKVGDQPVEDIPDSDGSSLAEMRALLLADKEEVKEQDTSIIEPSKLELDKAENCQESKEEIVRKPSHSSTPLPPPEKKEETLDEAGARLPISSNVVENEAWVDVAAGGDESTSAGQKSPAKDPSIDLNFEEWLES